MRAQMSGIKSILPMFGRICWYPTTLILHVPMQAADFALEFEQKKGIDCSTLRHATAFAAMRTWSSSLLPGWPWPVMEHYGTIWFHHLKLPGLSQPFLSFHKNEYGKIKSTWLRVIHPGHMTFFHESSDLWHFNILILSGVLSSIKSGIPYVIFPGMLSGILSDLLGMS